MTASTAAPADRRRLLRGLAGGAATLGLAAWPLQRATAATAATGQGRTGEPLPDFRLDRLAAAGGQAGPADWRGRAWALNVWASWCGPCRAELPLVQALAARVPVIGLNYKDGAEAALAWLAQHGNPFRDTLLDTRGEVGRRLALQGVPETLLVDARGIVQLRETGPLSEEHLRERWWPRLAVLPRG